MNLTSSISTCGNNFVFNTWLNYTLLASLPIIVFFCFLERRVNLWPTFLNGRPGIATPINLIDAYNDRLASALAFVCVSVLVFSKITHDDQNAIVQPSTDTVPLMLRGVLRFLNNIWKALLVCTASYPIFLCLGTKHKVTGKAIGVVYSLIWTAFFIGRLAVCRNELLFELSDLLISGPGFVFLVLLTFRFGHGLVKYLIRLRLNQLSSLKGNTAPSQSASSKFKESHFYQRTKYLLSRPLPMEYGGNFISRELRKYFYHERGFKFSRQNTSVLAMVLLLTYLTCTVSYS
ncbi:stimulated by retinoic acid gene 6 protein-like [Asterias rubens]|uniref:stimulated by retinoic acid gene 6 protein-like n=1 Tax=Asterias rubens TaxID=7604 RepID=UPI0014552AB6|nr:stimulated by retinoic acid gene 6 protein-like [Asterias rubens]